MDSADILDKITTKDGCTEYLNTISCMNASDIGSTSVEKRGLPEVLVTLIVITDACRVTSLNVTAQHY